MHINVVYKFIKTIHLLIYYKVIYNHKFQYSYKYKIAVIDT